MNIRATLKNYKITILGIGITASAVIATEILLINNLAPVSISAIILASGILTIGAFTQESIMEDEKE